jgi:protein-tyrosine phosphatase
MSYPLQSAHTHERIGHSLCAGCEVLSMNLTEFPFGLLGRVFGSPMPFGPYDQLGEVFSELKRNEVSVVVLLAENEEWLEHTQHNLPVLYAEHGLQVIHLPIPNYGVPPPGPLAVAITQTIEHANAENNALIHCSAGIGRTALFAVFLAMKVLGLSGREAIRWVGQHHPRALLTPAQIEMILGHTT